MPVFNCEKYIDEAIQSILDQTFQNFELLIIDDGSTDTTAYKISTYKDSRIRSIRFDSNEGLINALNYGLSQAKGKYIARMDADDISHPKRLESQVNFLEVHSEHVLCGMSVQILPTCQKKFPLFSDNEIRAGFLFSNVFYHSSVMFRSKVIFDHNLRYNLNYLGCEDYQLWIELGNYGKFSNLREIGLTYRIHDGQVTQNKSLGIDARLNLIRENYLKSIKIVYSDDQVKVFNKFCNRQQLSFQEYDLLSSFLINVQAQLSLPIQTFFKGIVSNFFSSYLANSKRLDFSLAYAYLLIPSLLRSFSLKHFFKLLKMDFTRVWKL